MPDGAEAARIEPVYATLLAEKKKHPDRRAGMEAGHPLLRAELGRWNLSYDRFLLSPLDQVA